MTIFQGRAKASDMLDTFDTIFKSAGYQEMSSSLAIDGRVYKTMGENGTSEFYIRLMPINNQYMQLYVCENYVPDPTGVLAGVFTNARLSNAIVWSTTDLATMDVDYIVNINRDRVIIFVEGETTDARSSSGLTYAGIPKRYGAEDTNANFAGIACLGALTNIGVAWYALKGRALVAQTGYTYAYYTTTKASMWGKQLFLSPITMGHGAEGPRGELDDLLIIRAPDVAYEARHKDTFVRDGKTYILLGKFHSASGSLPNAWYALKI